MEILLRSARIVDSGSPFHNRLKDILISDGKIKKIGNQLSNPSKATEVTADNLHVSIGWFCLHTFLADPGYEQKETVETGCRAAAFGGFTHICCLPNTNPVIQTKSQIEYIHRKALHEVVSVHPVGAMTQNCQGTDLTEMYDMYEACAIAFSDGLKPSVSAGTLERALLYVKAFNGIIFTHPEDNTISKNGVMNEGATSVKLGLPSAPALAEEIAVNRDLYILEYTESKLHFLDVSLSRSVELIRNAKKRGLKVSASANAYNLMLDEKALADYDTNCKVNPHLRTKQDIAELLKGITDGTIDTITSAHQPHEEDCKKLEFEKAEFGMIGLETCFAIANTVLNGKLSTGKIIQLFAHNPRKVVGMKIPKIKEGEDADLTLFNPKLKWTFSENDIQSKSKNTPFVGKKFTGKALGVINKGKLQLNS